MDRREDKALPEPLGSQDPPGPKETEGRRASLDQKESLGNPSSVSQDLGPARSC